ncbi:LPS export ABC transporter periplasmic protein LptC [Rhodalgimonas zhirmunskyi]|uniref:LPS export ABC transporter periplasmic protein LptC n=1 Tax=Rhodalgimonas zhirmunskyi TaxID=2964767 RepID=A0AAJ1UAS9_9RHOB|nr:LPS export ABC transporter periplasmic protein LptC [Rhodoalgimonas zhirmunskyi]MDQ2094278.1 LPS export ABC transporter periplasmic protein LptC [Rhodoalgimonas zhirmunskyi]
MPWRDNFHSRLVAWLKILLPLAALALLATLFLFSRNIDPMTTIPFAEIDLEARARDEGVTAPEFAGASAEGDLIAFKAATAQPEPGNTSRVLANDLSARIDLGSGGVVTFRAQTGTVDETANRAELSGDVVIETGQGYTLHSERLFSDMKRLYAESPGKVVGNGPPGQITAGRMVLERPENQAGAQLLFTDGVKLIYDPSKPGE